MIFTMLRKNKIWKVVCLCDTSSYHIWNCISLCRYGFFFRCVVFHLRETLVFEPEKSQVYNNIPYRIVSLAGNTTSGSAFTNNPLERSLFSQSKIELPSNLLFLGEIDKECS